MDRYTPEPHRFALGQHVRFARRSRFHTDGVFEITRLLPLQDEEPKYRLKSIDEAHERVVGEAELLPVTPP